jgi:hypothetical protein
LLAFIFGIVGWFAVKYDYPLAPMILGIILGGPFERSIVQSSEIGRGSLTVYFHHPIAMGLLAVVIAMVVLPPVISRLRRKAGRPSITEMTVPPDSVTAQRSSQDQTATGGAATATPGLEMRGNGAHSESATSPRGSQEKGEETPLIARGQIGKN